MSDLRVMVIGLDGATLDLAEPWAREGRLPNLARFLEHGAAGPLLSTLPPTSPAAWSTFATGLNPGKHGILHFLQLAPDSYEARLADASRRRGATFWEVAGQQGVPGGIINVPCTYPPRPYNGFLVSGLLTPSVGPSMVSPPDLLGDVMAASPLYAIDVDVVKAGAGVGPAFAERLLGVLQARIEAAVGLYRRHRPPLFCVVFTAADRACHRFWHELKSSADGGTVPLVYEKLDEAVGALVSEAGRETDVLVLSDHGAGPLRRSLSLRNLLVRAGLLVEARPGLLTPLGQKAVRTFVRVAPRTLKNRLRARFARLARRAGGMLVCGGIDFARTAAYPAGEMSGAFVNLKGRQPRGIINPGRQYEQVRDRIVAAAQELEDPDTGRPVFRKAHRREEVWSGPCLDRLPDVILEQDEEVYDVRYWASPHGEVFGELGGRQDVGWRKTGGHRRHGLLMAMGPHVRNVQIERAEMADVPATILALLGCSIPDSFDGRVLTEILSDDVDIPARIRDDSDRQRQSRDFSEEDRDAVAKRLKGLGYL